jgi:hypothetical protein
MKLPLFLVAAFCALTPTLALHGQTTLSLLNGASSSLTITPGQSFSLGVYVSNLSASLDGFDLEFSSLPANVTLQSYTDTVPANWITFGNSIATLQYGASNLFGSDIQGGGEILQANFTTTSLLAPGHYTFSFVPEDGLFQELHDASQTNIPYTESDFTLYVTSSSAVPEPSTWALLFAGLGVLAFAVRKRSRA